MIAAADRIGSPVVAGVVEVDGVSGQGWHDAVWQAIASVLRPGRHITHPNVLAHSTALRGGETEYRVSVRLAYSAWSNLYGHESAFFVHPQSLFGVPDGSECPEIPTNLVSGRSHVIQVPVRGRAGRVSGRSAVPTPIERTRSRNGP
jgi:hypothetical protein